MYHLLLYYKKPECICVFRTILTINSDYFPKKNINRLVFVAETYCVSCEVRTEYLYIICVFRMVLTINSDYVPEQN
jgi:hypothetical protein